MSHVDKTLIHQPLTTRLLRKTSSWIARSPVLRAGLLCRSEGVELFGWVGMGRVIPVFFYWTNINKHHEDRFFVSNTAISMI